MMGSGLAGNETEPGNNAHRVKGTERKILTQKSTGSKQKTSRKFWFEIFCDSVLKSISFFIN